MTSRRNWPVMFRAGAAAGEEPSPPALAAPHAATLSLAPKVLLADISEFQADINDAAYLLWSKAIIIRAAYGAQHDDRAWFGGQRRDALHAGGARFLGIYQYIVAGQDPAVQARTLVGLIGAMRPGEKIILDVEEGAGGQAGRRDAAAAVIRAGLGDEPWTYSGLNFAAAHGLAPVEWVAAYQHAEPAVRHVLWQNTNAFDVPGVGTADCSVFHGTIDDLAALAWPGSKPAPNWTEKLLATLPALQQGNRDHPGSVQFVHRIQALVKVVGDINHLAQASAVKADGNFGTATWTGVLAVQKFFGLAEDGIVAEHTWRALIAGQRP